LVFFRKSKSNIDRNEKITYPVRMNKFFNTFLNAVAILAFIGEIILLLSACGPRRPPTTVSAVSDMDGKTIGALVGSAASVLAADLGEVREYSTAEAMLGDLYAGAIDCAVADDALVPSLLKSSRGIRALDEPLISAGLSIVAAKESRDLTADVNAALKTLRENKTLASLADKHILGKAFEYVPDDVPDSAGSLRLAVSADFPPYCFKNSEGAVTGLDTDVARAVCGILGVKLEVIEVERADIITAVWAGRADFGAGGLYMTPEGGELVDFSDSYATCVQRVLTRK
jgi:polar amino acid transport system substrate-binding protein